MGSLRWLARMLSRSARAALATDVGDPPGPPFVRGEGLWAGLRLRSCSCSSFRFPSRLGFVVRGGYARRWRLMWATPPAPPS